MKKHLEDKTEICIERKRGILNKAKSKTKRYNATGCYNEGAGTKILMVNVKTKSQDF